MCKILPPAPQYITSINHLYQKYINYLEDDYNEDTIADIMIRTYPFFRIILSDTSSFVGFMYLDNITGNSKKLHSGEITVCISPKFWGDWTQNKAKTILDFYFQNLGLTKIKALVYPDNFRVKTLLNKIGFKKEADLKYETIRKDKLQDIEIYSIFRKGLEQ